MKSFVHTVFAAVLSLLIAAQALATEKVNINTADAAALDRVLVGVGPSKAAAIVEYRKANGPFKSAEELAMVKGIGLSTVEQNRERIELPLRRASRLPQPRRPPSRSRGADRFPCRASPQDVERQAQGQEARGKQAGCRQGRIHIAHDAQVGSRLQPDSPAVDRQGCRQRPDAQDARPGVVVCGWAGAAGPGAG